MGEYILTSNGELYHWGIKGMKWGQRRYQNKDGSLTAAGRKRYSDDPKLAESKAAVKQASKDRTKALADYNKAYNKYYAVPTKGNKKRFDEAFDNLRKADSSLKSTKFKYGVDKEAARLREKGYNNQNKSKHRQNLEEKYKKLGLTDEEAQAAANKRIRTERIVAGAAALTVAACAAYYGNKYYKTKIDGVIKAGDFMQRVEMQDTNNKLHDVFYVSKGKHDNKRYAGMLGMTRQQQTGEAYLMKLQAQSDIKVASQEKARKVFEDLYKNDRDFRIAAYDLAGEHFSGKNVANLFDDSPKGMKKLYENFNSNLIGARESGVDKKFYDALKAQGYGAIQDINDMKFSGYKAKNPLIVFDNSGGNIMVKSMTKMEDQTMNGIKELGKATLETMMEQNAYLPAAGMTVAAVATYARDPKSEYNPEYDKTKN